MKLGLISQSFSLVTVVLAVASAGCSGTSSSSNGLNNPPQGPGGDDAGASQPPSVPHALATITIGESHESGGTTSTPLVSASFIPDATQAPAVCTTNISGCTIAMPAVCNSTTVVCTSDQVCSLDASCHPQCVPACTAVCPAGEVCQLGTNGAQSCVAVQAAQTFNGGDIVFSGTGLAIPITLLAPDYTFTSTTTGSPFVPGGTIDVTGEGAASGAGFAPFQESFTATTLLQTSPALTTLTAADVYAATGLALGWQPGSDSITIEVTGPAGTATCTASDASGKFTVPAAVISNVSGTGSPGVSVSVTRQRLSEKTDGKTQGTLVGETVQPVGYIDLSTSSTESYAIQGCGESGEGDTMCADGCVNLLTSTTDCGACGHSCGTGYCSSGTCYGTTGCTTPYTSCSGTCVDLETSVTNCGSCGYVCPNSGDYCVSGVCSTTDSCPTDYTSCSDGCQDLQTSSTDCGECGNSCDGGTCTSGTCSTGTTTCATCESSAEESTCASDYSTCNADANCGNYSSCMAGCTAGNTSCYSTCETDYPTGMTEAENLRTCICSTACSSSCSTQTYCTETL